MDSSPINAQARALLDAIREASKPQGDPVPPGFMSMIEIVKQFGQSEKLVRRAIKSVPNLEVLRLRRPINGRLQIVPHYGLSRAGLKIGR